METMNSKQVMLLLSFINKHSYISMSFSCVFLFFAGNKMLDSCAPIYSCGSLYPLWTDDEMPQDIGVETTVRAYRTSSSPCEYNYYQYSGSLHVVRCSWDTKHDLVYKFVPSSYSSTCYYAFCGMK